MFPDNIEILERTDARAGRGGILVGAEVASIPSGTATSRWPGDTLLLTAMSEARGDQSAGGPGRRDLPVQAEQPGPRLRVAHRHHHGARSAGMNLFSAAPAELTEAEAALLGEIDESALFGGGARRLLRGQLR